MLFLGYRQAVIEGHIASAQKTVDKLFATDLSKTPLNMSMLSELQVMLRFWAPVLELPSSPLPLDIELLLGQAKNRLKLVKPQTDGVYSIPNRHMAQYQVTNQSKAPVFLYFIALRQNGRMANANPAPNRLPRPRGTQSC